MTPIFPFTAIVGQERMKRALILNAIHPQIGGVLIRGERGTAKSTAARALAALLPEIEAVADCPFGCDPDQPATWCTECLERAETGEELPRARRRTRFVDLPVSATEDRVVGTLDIERAIQKGERHFEPGVLASANRGVLYVDEVNLLDDHVVDLLLDAAAMGVNVVEREGISFSHPARFILVGTMNPEEGDLRPQLLDRFALCVDIQGILDPAARMAIMERNLLFEADPEGFCRQWAAREEALSNEIARARRLLPQVRYTQADLATIATMMGELGVDGHRADLVVLKTARAHAAFEGRTGISDRDIFLASELALPHRLKRHPLQEAQVTLGDLGERLEAARAQNPVEAEVVEGDDANLETGGKKKAISGEVRDDEPPGDQREVAREPGLQVVPQWPSEGSWWDYGEEVEVGETFAPRRLDTPLDRLTRSSGGRRSQTRTDRKRGRYVQSRPSPGDATDLAFDATLRAAAPHQQKRHRDDGDGPALKLHPDDYRRKVRVRRAANLVLFVVDASWSMAVAERMQATKGAVMSLLTDAYQQRDRVGMVVFQKNDASVVLPPTNSVELARRALADIPVGGKTPLSAGLQMAYEVITRELRQHPELMPLMVLLTDGAGNVSMSNLPPQEEAYRISEMFPSAHIRSVVINMEHEAFDQGLAETLADHLQAPCYTLAELKTEALVRTVWEELGDQAP
ncbi:MAG: putative cobaltochelatase [Chloroflexi bacterium]|nr:MAG: putative cobaltochelatase [Chloroflexota bacterium]